MQPGLEPWFGSAGKAPYLQAAGAKRQTAGPELSRKQHVPRDGMIIASVLAWLRQSPRCSKTGRRNRGGPERAPGGTSLLSCLPEDEIDEIPEAFAIGDWPPSGVPKLTLNTETTETVQLGHWKINSALWMFWMWLIGPQRTWATFAYLKRQPCLVSSPATSPLPCAAAPP